MRDGSGPSGISEITEIFCRFAGVLRHPRRIDSALCRLTQAFQVQSMALMCPWQVYLPRLGDRVELHPQHRIGLRRAHWARGLYLPLAQYSGQRCLRRYPARTGSGVDRSSFSACAPRYVNGRRLDLRSYRSVRRLKHCVSGRTRKSSSGWWLLIGDRAVGRINSHVFCRFAIVLADGSGARTTQSFETLSASPSRIIVMVEVVTATTGYGPVVFDRNL